MEKAHCTNCGKENSVNYKYCFECGYEMPKSDLENISEVNTTIKKHKFSRQKLLNGLAFAVVFAISYFAVQYLFFGTDSINKNMMKVASQLNESCPMMVDSETRLDNTIALTHNVFQYQYTLVNIDKNEVIPEEIKKVIESGIINKVKTNPDMQGWRDLKVTYKYSYNDKNSLFLFDITVGPDQYQ